MMQLPFLNERKGENDDRKYLMINFANKFIGPVGSIIMSSYLTPFLQVLWQ